MVVVHYKGVIPNSRDLSLLGIPLPQTCTYNIFFNGIYYWYRRNVCHIETWYEVHRLNSKQHSIIDY